MIIENRLKVCVMTASRTKQTVAIVGAGIAGLAAARQLCDAGVSVTVFEKSADIGGRMATQTQGRMAFDHGAPSFDFNALAFRDVAASWRPVVAPWRPAATVGIPDMKAPARILAAGMTIITGQTVLSCSRQVNGWTLTLSNGECTGGFSAVVLAIPSPQSAPLSQAASARCLISRWLSTARAGR